MNYLQKIFKLKEHNTTLRIELLAGLTTFLTMAYIIFVNPKILADAGMNMDAVFVATCLVAAFGTLLIALMTNYPLAIAPGMALNVYFSYVIVLSHGYSWQSALGAVLISGLIFLFLTISKIRFWIIKSIPHNISVGTSIGIGLFIILIALEQAGIVKGHPKTLIDLNTLTNVPSILFFLGFWLIIILDYFKVIGSIVISIGVITLAGILLGTTHFQGAFALPPSIKPTLFAFDLKSLLNFQSVPIIFTFLLVALFDSTGTMIGVLQHESFAEGKNKDRKIGKALLADSIATTTGACLGTSTASIFIESAAGIRAGGRTGLTAMVIAILFLSSLFLSPLLSAIPSYAVAPALFYVGVLMIKNFEYLELKDLTSAVPSIITAIMIPFGFSIADGLGLGIISYVVIKLCCGKLNELNVVLLILSLVFIAYFIVAPA